MPQDPSWVLRHPEPSERAVRIEARPANVMVAYWATTPSPRRMCVEVPALSLRAQTGKASEVRVGRAEDQTVFDGKCREVKRQNMVRAKTVYCQYDASTSADV